MTKLALIGGFYEAASLSANAQRCLNVFPERNQADAPYPYTYYLRPGLTTLAQAPYGAWRGLYVCGINGQLYGVCGPNVYRIDGAFHLHLLGTIGTTRGIVSFADNRLSIVLVDGTPNGYVIDPATDAFQTISAGNGAFYGADRVRYVDTFLVFNRPATNQFYISLSEVTPAMLSGGPAVDGTIVGGSGYSNGVHVGVPLTGGSGTDAVAEITVAAGAVTAVSITVGGDSYRVGDVLSAAGASLGGGVSTGTIVGGSGYADATYTNVALTGGTGSGAQATIVVSGGAVTSVTPSAAGSGYTVGDVLTAPAASLGGAGSGFTWTVTALAAAGSGFTYTLTEVGSSAFDLLDIAAKVGGSDDIVALDILHRDIWLFGARGDTEIWYLSGGADFAFSRMPGVYVEHGCQAINSVAHTDLTIFWLGKDTEGNSIAFVGENYTALRISTYAIEQEWASYPVANDAIGFTYQKRGHTFYQLTFPSADKTWVYDYGEKLWHEAAWTDENAVEHRHRANCAVFAYSRVIAGDFENGKLYAFDLDAHQDDEDPILWRRSAAHMVADGNRVTYHRAIARIAAGQTPGLLTSDAPKVSLRYSDTGGESWSNPRTMSLGSGGQYGATPTWQQLGMGRDRVFELFGEATPKQSLSGFWIEATAAKT